MTVGQKVVCIDGKFPPAILALYWDLPAEGKVYVIRAVFIGRDVNGEPGEVGLLLVGLKNPCSTKPPFAEHGFNSLRFRPLNEESEVTEREEVESWKGGA